jgi:uncharacterized protein DUF3352
VRATRLFTAAVLTTLSLLLAACGGGGDGSTANGGTTPAGAALVRASLIAFLSIDSDLSSAQWQQADALSKKFPGRSRLIAQLKQTIGSQGVDYDRDVKPALGPELDIAIASGGTSESTSAVGLTKPEDPAKLEALVAKMNASDSSGEPAVFREVDGWYAISNSQAAIDRVLKGGDRTLAVDSTFMDAVGKLPGDALVKAYLDGQQLNAVIKNAAAQSGSSFDLSSTSLGDLKYVVASATAEDDGFRVHGASSGAEIGDEFASKLVGGVPGDAFALLDFSGQGTTKQLEKLKSNPQVAQALQQMQALLGVSFDDVLALLRNEIALYVRPGAGIPEVTLALDTSDQSAALSTLDRLAARLAAATGGQVQPGTQGGHAVKTVNLGRFAVHYGGLDGKVLITSGLTGIADYGASGERLPDSADFKQAQEAAGMPDSTGGFLYLDLKDALPLLQGFAALAGQELPADVTENLRPLRSFLAWSEGSGSSQSFDAFLEIK